MGTESAITSATPDRIPPSNLVPPEPPTTPGLHPKNTPGNSPAPHATVEILNTPAPPVVFNLSSIFDPPGTPPQVQIAASDSGGSGGFRARITGDPQVLCTDPFAPNSGAPQCVGTLPAAGTYSFQASYFVAGQWTAWSAPSTETFIGDECGTVQWISTDTKKVSIPLDTTVEVVVGHTTPSAAGGRTSLDVADRVLPGQGVSIRLASGNDHDVLGYLPIVKFLDWDDPRHNDFPANVEPVVVRIPEVLTTSGPSREKFHITVTWAHLSSGAVCQVDASIDLTVIRTDADSRPGTGDGDGDGDDAPNDCDHPTQLWHSRGIGDDPIEFWHICESTSLPED